MEEIKKNKQTNVLIRFEHYLIILAGVERIY